MHDSRFFRWPPVKLSDKVLDRIRRTVKAEPWAPDIPTELQPGYRLRRQKQFSRLSVLGGPLLIGVFLVDTISGLALFGKEIAGPDHALWIGYTIGCGMLVLLAMILSRFRATHPSYHIWSALIAGLVLVNRILLCESVSNIRLAEHQTQLCMLTIMIVVIALRLTVTLSTACCLLAGLLAYGSAWALGLHPDYAQVSVYFLDTFLICTMMSWMLERQERLNFLRFVLLDHEAHERDIVNARLERLSLLDNLTGLANRRQFDDTLALEWERARRDQTPVALLFLDVDNFKLYNDTQGHPAGDACLMQIAEVLTQALLRPADMAARYGGEEFVLLLPGTDHVGAREVAERICAEVDRLAIPHPQPGGQDHVTVSIGVATMRPAPTNMPGQLVEKADAAMYEAKRRGRHGVAEVLY
jgi:diguanylate cyclase (GGDEF)-like protein